MTAAHALTRASKLWNVLCGILELLHHLDYAFLSQGLRCVRVITLMPSTSSVWWKSMTSERASAACVEVETGPVRLLHDAVIALIGSIMFGCGPW